MDTSFGGPSGRGPLGRGAGRRRRRRAWLPGGAASTPIEGYDPNGGGISDDEEGHGTESHVVRARRRCARARARAPRFPLALSSRSRA